MNLQDLNVHELNKGSFTNKNSCKLEAVTPVVQRLSHTFTMYVTIESYIPSRTEGSSLVVTG